jgi:hypothetical protein
LFQGIAKADISEPQPNYRTPFQLHGERWSGIYAHLRHKINCTQWVIFFGRDKGDVVYVCTVYRCEEMIPAVWTMLDKFTKGSTMDNRDFSILK